MDDSPVKINLGGKPSVKVLFIQYAETEEEKQNAKYDMENFHEVFLDEADLTEYKAAMRLTGSWEEWSRFKHQWPTFRYNIAKWKEELEVKLRSDAMSKLVSLVASKSDQTAATVCKFLVQSGWDKREGAGRPSKTEMRKQAQEIARVAADTKEEEDRILELIDGGKSSNG